MAARKSRVVALALCLWVGLFWSSPGAPGAEVNFRRGDANQSGGADISDAICILTYLFVGGGVCASPGCLDALDTDDNEAVQITDAIFLLSYLFSGGVREIPPPFAYCGIDLSFGEPQILGCDSYSQCEDVDLTTFSEPEACATCHPRQYREWSGSMHSYAGQSPLFNALEMVGNRLLSNHLRPGGAFPSFCIKCHNAIGTALGEIPRVGPDTEVRPTVEHASILTGRGIQCDVCHSIRKAHSEVTVFQQEESGDRAGVANAAFRLEAGINRFGPLADPVPNSAHMAREGEPEFFRSGDFCGMCHDVRIPGRNEENHEPFLRLENLFTEWETGPYANRDDPGNIFGKVIACQDCHMSLFPFAAPGTFPSGRVAENSLDGLPPVRPRVSTHFFTAVDRALIDFPNQFGDRLDDYGNPASQDARRRRYLEVAATMSLDDTRRDIQVGAESVTLPVRVQVKNFLTGHGLPAGFSQERQIWVQLEVEDGGGQNLYRSGHLEDRAHPETGEMAPDGKLGDEDLLDKSVVLDPTTGEATVVPGPDYNLRPKENRGLVSFQNAFVRREDGGTPDDPTDDTEEEVFLPFLASHIDNSISLKPLEARTYTYDVAVPPGTAGPITVRARLLFRQFPPYFVRFLAGQLPDYVSEETVDRLDIVEMTSATLSVAVNGVGSPDPLCIDYETRIQPIWNRRCLPCHSSGSPIMGLDLSPGVSWENLVNARSQELTLETLVVPSNPGLEPGGSFLAHKLLRPIPRTGDRMPSGGALPLPEREIDLILRWIAEGALRSAPDPCP